MLKFNEKGKGISSIGTIASTDISIDQKLIAIISFKNWNKKDVITYSLNALTGMLLTEPNGTHEVKDESEIS